MLICLFFDKMYKQIIPGFNVASLRLSLLQSPFDANHGKPWPKFIFCKSEAVLVCSFVK